MSEREEEMSKEEMQRFLLMEARKGCSKAEAFDDLLEILGIQWPEQGEKAEGL